MPRRSDWKGYLKLGRVNVPVRAYTATQSTRSEIPLRHIHRTCRRPIRHQRVCPVHGPIEYEEVASGYEVGPDQFVEIGPEEIEAVHTRGVRSASVEAFIDPGAVDPLYHTGKSFYLVPDGAAGQRAYGLVRQAMEEEGVHGVAQIVIGGKEQLVLLRPLGRFLIMTVLEYDERIKPPSSFEDELEETEITDREVLLTRELVRRLRRENFDMADYKDPYKERLVELIDAKSEGRELPETAPTETPGTLRLLEALEESLRQAQSLGEETEPAKDHGRRRAPASHRRRSPAEEPRKND